MLSTDLLRIELLQGLIAVSPEPDLLAEMQRELCELILRINPVVCGCGAVHFALPPIRVTYLDCPDLGGHYWPCKAIKPNGAICESTLIMPLFKGEK